jgi:hypothetical protein
MLRAPAKAHHHRKDTMHQFLRWLKAIISPAPIKYKTYYRGWKIQIDGKDALVSRGQERFYASPRLGIVELVAFCKRKVDRLERY